MKIKLVGNDETYAVRDIVRLFVPMQKYEFVQGDDYDVLASFENGGYLLIDELENHFNHEIVSTLIRFYMDAKVNKSGATLVFSTHYAEVLDEFERNDSIYIVRNRNGITAENLSKILKRNDIKKSEAYESDFLKGTVPAYEAYMNLKRTIISSDKESK
mgnify:CR=1 FL=1